MSLFRWLSRPRRSFSPQPWPRWASFFTGLAVHGLLLVTPSLWAQEPAAAEPSARSAEGTAPQEADSMDGPATGEGATATEEPMLETNDGDPQWLEKLLLRTTEPLAPREVASEDGYFKAKLPAELLEPITPFDGGYLMALSFAAVDGVRGECYVYEDAMDMASYMVSISDHLFGIVETTHGEIELKEVQGVEVGNLGPVPYLGLAWLYQTKAERPEDAVVGQVKHWLANKQQRSLYCFSTVMGYDDLLFGLFRSLAETLELGEPPTSLPYYEEVSQIRVGEQLVGISHLASRIDEDGDIEDREMTSMLVPLDQQTLMTSDSLAIGYSTLDGDVITKMEYASENGELVTELRLDYEDDGGWTVKGNFQGKALEATLGEGAALRSGFGERLDFAEFLKTAKPSSVMTNLAWEAGFDPTTFVESSVTYLAPQPTDGDEPHHQVKLALGPLELHGVVDGGLSAVTVGLQMGATQMSIERLYTQGDIWHPRSLPAFAEAMVSRDPPSEAADGSTAGSTSDDGVTDQ